MARAALPRASVAPVGGAAYSNWRALFAQAIRWPWFEASVSTAPAPQPALAPEPFEHLKAIAASGHAGCVAARKRLKHATNAGLARALGRELPVVLR